MLNVTYTTLSVPNTMLVAVHVESCRIETQERAIDFGATAGIDPASGGVGDLSADTWPTAISHVESERVDPDAMVIARFPLEKAAEALDSDGVPGTVKPVVTVS
jgi:hypothetical protein